MDVVLQSDPVQWVLTFATVIGAPVSIIQLVLWSRSTTNTSLRVITFVVIGLCVLAIGGVIAFIIIHNDYVLPQNIPTPDSTPRNTVGPSKYLLPYGRNIVQFSIVLILCCAIFHLICRYIKYRNDQFEKHHVNEKLSKRAFVGCMILAIGEFLLSTLICLFLVAFVVSIPAMFIILIYYILIFLSVIPQINSDGIDIIALWLASSACATVWLRLRWLRTHKLAS
jgi:hypothetical protein